MPRLVIVCNRANPPKDAGSGTLGGVPVALAAALRASHGIWFGWSGRTAAEFHSAARLSEVGGFCIAAIDLGDEDAAEYFQGYANNALWPTFHYEPRAYTSPSLAGYERLNARFAEALRPLLREDDIVWAHDYQLIFLARELRSLGVENPIGFFLHIPWPPMQLIAMLPQHRRLVGALFSYDLVGFHTEEWRRAFLDYAQAEFGLVTGENNRFFPHVRETSTGVFPAGIDARGYAKAAFAPEARAAFRAAQRWLEGRRMLLGVDRLDLPKGLEDKFLAYEYWLARHPDERHGVVLHQIAPDMTEATSTYRAIRRRLKTLTRRINRRFANGAEAVSFVNRMHRRHELAGWYRAAAVCLATPLRDGMNLVAKEYIAAQDPGDPGVLVLSRFAGAAAEMSDALIVNPYSREDMAAAISAALAMPKRERIARHERLMHGLLTHDADSWVRSFLFSLEACTNRASLPPFTGGVSREARRGAEPYPRP